MVIKQSNLHDESLAVPLWVWLVAHLCSCKMEVGAVSIYNENKRLFYHLHPLLKPLFARPARCAMTVWHMGAVPVRGKKKIYVSIYIYMLLFIYVFLTWKQNWAEGEGSFPAAGGGRTDSPTRDAISDAATGCYVTSKVIPQGQWGQPERETIVNFVWRKFFVRVIVDKVFFLTKTKW